MLKDVEDARPKGLLDLIMVMFIIEEHDVRVYGVDIGGAFAAGVGADPPGLAVGELALLHEGVLPCRDHGALAMRGLTELKLRHLTLVTCQKARHFIYINN